MKPKGFQKWIPHLLVILSAAAISGCDESQSMKGAPGQVTVPLVLEGNRPFIDLTFPRADGSQRTARFLVDTGGGAFLITEGLARELGLEWGKTMKEEGREFARPNALPKAFVGAMPLQLSKNRVFVALGSKRILPAVTLGHEEGMLPGHVLAHYHVVFDYPKATLTLAQPGILKPEGDVLPMPVSKRSRFPRTEIKVDGITYGLLLDTGASFTLVSEVLLKSWGTKHPNWPRSPGAAGEAATLGGTTLETMFLPDALWGTNQLGEFGVASQREGTFEKWMSKMMTAPIVGSLAGNVLKRYRVELDYANEKLYLSAPLLP